MSLGRCLRIDQLNLEEVGGGGVHKKGLLQADLILYTYGYHLSCLETILAKYPRLPAPPIAAFLLAIRAVHIRYNSGVPAYASTMGTSCLSLLNNFFSSDNWDDYTIANPDPRGKRDKLVRRATKLLASVKKWDTERWDEIKAGAMEAPSRRRAASSRSASEPGDAMFSDDDEVIIVSD
ncbi:hypothetical protein B0H13DRAFT_2311335 [Mycena leptocephala]|nr:hypothetical protein B0H13DRAFT_2311335 [Mycena leptocephala]